MKRKKKPIFLALSPNAEREDVFLALKCLFRPWKWQKGGCLKELEKRFKEFLEVRYASAFNSGRSALLALLDGLGIKEGSEVLVQGFTCNALINPLIWSGLVPRYVDIEEETLNMSVEDLKKKINERTKLVVVQHTFGCPACIREIKDICEKNNITLIEDCAHSIGARVGDKKTGAFGRAAFFSLGRSKIISSVYGGVVVTDDDELAGKIRSFRQGLSLPSPLWTARQLLHPVLTSLFVKPFYGLGDMGRLLLVAFQRLGVLSKAVHKKEKIGRRPSYFPKPMPDSLACLGLKQMDKLKRFIYQQNKLADYYREGFRDLDSVRLTTHKEGRVYMRFPILTEGGKASKIRKGARKENIFLEDGWRGRPVVPPDTDQKKMGYHWGECPTAERVARRIVNLPTNINTSVDDVSRIISFIKGKLS